MLRKGTSLMESIWPVDRDNDVPEWCRDIEQAVEDSFLQLEKCQTTLDDQLSKPPLETNRELWLTLGMELECRVKRLVQVLNLMDIRIKDAISCGYSYPPMNFYREIANATVSRSRQIQVKLMNRMKIIAGELQNMRKIPNAKQIFRVSTPSYVDFSL